MGEFSFEIWLDILVMMVAVLAVLVGGWTAWKMFGKESKEEAKPASIPQSNTFSKYAPARKKSREPGKPAFPEPVKKVVKPAPVSSPVLAGNVKAAKPALKEVKPKEEKLKKKEEWGGFPKPAEETPFLITEDLILRAGNTLLLRMRNEGSTLYYQRLGQGKDCEVKVTYQPMARNVSFLQEDYPYGSTLSFLLTGTDLEKQTYEFEVFFSDKTGKLFRQKVAGMGKEVPLLDAPEMLR
ncbi:MAG: hypothetical protein AAFR61_07320 [Bacteroidota bacterium]